MLGANPEVAKTGVIPETVLANFVPLIGWTWTKLGTGIVHPSVCHALLFSLPVIHTILHGHHATTRWTRAVLQVDGSTQVLGSRSSLLILLEVKSQRGKWDII